jgi:hypothetical protein
MANRFDSLRAVASWRYLLNVPQPAGQVHATYRGKSIGITAGPVCPNNLYAVSQLI